MSSIIFGSHKYSLLNSFIIFCSIEAALNTLRPRQNGRPFPDDIFKCIFLNENLWISINIPMKFVPKGPIKNIPALFHYLKQWWSFYWRIYASLCLNELINCSAFFSWQIRIQFKNRLIYYMSGPQYFSSWLVVARNCQMVICHRRNIHTWYQWLSTRLHYLQCFITGDNAALHKAIAGIILRYPYPADC